MIECNPNVGFGQPTLKGRRLTVYNIVTKLYYEEDVSVILNNYEITFQDARDAVNYCMKLKCKEDDALLQFCDGCLLRTIADGWHFNKDGFVELKGGNSNVVISKDGKIIFAGSLQEFEDSEFGKVTWLMAEQVNLKLDEQGSDSN